MNQARRPCSGPPMDYDRLEILFARLRDHGDRQAFSTIVEMTVGYMYAYAYTLTRDPTRARDLVQETFLKFAYKYSEIKKGRAVLAWLRTVARNCRRKVLPDRRQTLMPDIDDDILGMDKSMKTAFELVVEEEDRRLIDDDMPKALATLSPTQRACVRLRCMEGKSLPETAAILGISEKAVQEACSKGRSKMSDFNWQVREI